MGHGHRPVKRLLVVPALTVAALIGGLQVFEAFTAPAVDVGPDPDVHAGIPIMTGGIQTCQRGSTTATSPNCVRSRSPAGSPPARSSRVRQRSMGNA